jgi:hypothetical protein
MYDDQAFMQAQAAYDAALPDDEADELDHDCLAPAVCGSNDLISWAAGMYGAEHVLRCTNAPDPNIVACRCGGKTPLSIHPHACQWCGAAFSA